MELPYTITTLTQLDNYRIDFKDGRSFFVVVDKLTAPFMWDALACAEYHGFKAGTESIAQPCGHGCVLGTPKGMATNGRCGCLEGLDANTRRTVKSQLRERATLQALVDKLQASKEVKAIENLQAANAELYEVATWMLALIDGHEQMPQPGDEITKALRRATIKESIC